MIYFNTDSVPQKSLDPDQVTRLRTFKNQFPKEGLWWPYKGQKQFGELVESHLRKYLNGQIQKKRDQEPITSIGQALQAEDFHRGQEVLKHSDDVGFEARKAAWLDMRSLNEVAERLFQSREFCEIRSKLGNSLGLELTKLFMQNKAAEVEKFLLSCAIPPQEIKHLVRVATEAMNHLVSTDGGPTPNRSDGLTRLGER